jgi:asparagine synthase (glutamine-hydrolysing)
MCGLCGAYDLAGRSSSQELLARVSSFLKALSHRGFYSGQYHDPQASLAMGMVRLPITDTGSPIPIPFSNEDGTLRMAVNGEIYNAGELPRLLKRKHTFGNKTDVEVMLHLYEEMGTEFVQHLEGMFSFAIWDIPKKRLMLARDQAGVKPLFYLQKNGTFYFASEVRAFKILFPDLLLDPTALYNYLCLQYVPQPHTIYQEVRALMPGESLVADASGVRIQSYWKPSDQRTRFSIRDADSISQKAEMQIRRNIERALFSEQPIGVLLSGGVDSSLLTMIASQYYPQKLRTYSVAVDENSFNEASFSRRVARMAGSEHHEVLLDEEVFFKILEEAIGSFDQPFSEGSFIPYFLICREAQKEVRVLLAGEGADELFGGYEIYRALFWKRYFERFPKSLIKLVSQMVSWMPVSLNKVSLDFKIKRFLEGVHVEEVYAHVFWRRALSEIQLQRLLRPDFLASIRFDEKAVFMAEEFWRGREVQDPLAKHLLIDQKIPMVSDLLYRADMMSMVHTMEIRVPFLQRELIDFSYRIPSSLKLNAFSDKILLRKIAARYLPRDIAYKKKQGFNIPYAKWLLTQKGDDFLDRCLLNNPSLEALLAPEEVRRLVAEHRSRKIDHGHALWTLLVLAVWNERQKLF